MPQIIWMGSRVGMDVNWGECLKGFSLLSTITNNIIYEVKGTQYTYLLQGLINLLVPNFYLNQSI